jgi:hypothetical protein
VRLSDALITNEKYRGEPTTDEEGRTQWPVCILWDDEIQGFGVRIYPPVRGRPSRKDFIVSWKIGLKTRYMAIGTYGVGCTLRQARRAAREAIDLARRGQDPIEARQRALGIGTAEDLASRFLFEHTAAKKKPVSEEQAPSAPEPGTGAPPGPPSEAQEPAMAQAAPEQSAPGPASSPSSAEEPQPPAADAEASSVPTSPLAADPNAVDATPVAPVAPDTVDDSPVEEAEAEPEVTEVSAAAPASAIEAPAVPSPSEQPAAPSIPEGPASEPAGAPKLDETLRGQSAATAPSRRGPTKVRLLPVPDALYRTIEHGARESGMTIAAYLNALIEIARAAVGEEVEVRAGDAASPTNEHGPSIGELFARVQEAQAVEVGEPSSRADDAERDAQTD